MMMFRFIRVGTSSIGINQYCLDDMQDELQYILGERTFEIHKHRHFKEPSASRHPPVNPTSHTEVEDTANTPRDSNQVAIFQFVGYGPNSNIKQHESANPKNRSKK